METVAVLSQVINNKNCKNMPKYQTVTYNTILYMDIFVVKNTTREREMGSERGGEKREREREKVRVRKRGGWERQ